MQACCRNIGVSGPILDRRDSSPALHPGASECLPSSTLPDTSTGSGDCASLGPRSAPIVTMMLAKQMLCRHLRLMHVATPASRRTICFTKGYSHYAEGTGSVLQVGTLGSTAGAQLRSSRAGLNWPVGLSLALCLAEHGTVSQRLSPKPTPCVSPDPPARATS